jgi:hypothetical protein
MLIDSKSARLHSQHSHSLNNSNKNLKTEHNLKYFIVLVTFPLLFPSTRVILEKLIVAKLVKKLPEDDCLLGYCTM